MPTGKKGIERKTTPKKSHVNEQEEKGFLVEAAENIEIGAKVVGEKSSQLASDIAELTSKLAGKFVAKVKKGTEQALDFSSQVVSNLSESANEYTEKYKDKFEISKIKKEQEDLYLHLGKSVFEKNRIMGVKPENLLKQKDIKELMNVIDQNVKKIISIGKEFDKTK